MEERKPRHEVDPLDDEVKELIIPEILTVIVYSNRGEAMDGWAGGKIVIEYCHSGQIAHVYRPIMQSWEDD